MEQSKIIDMLETYQPAHVRLGDVPRTHDPVKLRGRASSARRRDDGDDVATGTGLHLSTTMI